MQRTRRFEPHIPKGRKGYVVTFFHPVLKKHVSKGLGTRLLDEARTICADLGQLCVTPTTWDGHADWLSAYDYRALSIFFGSDHPVLKKVDREVPSSLLGGRGAVRPQEIVKATQQLIRVLEKKPLGPSIMPWSEVTSELLMIVQQQSRSLIRLAEVAQYWKRRYMRLKAATREEKRHR
jgi:hypothetical protein